jgi:hypothetical protein
MRKKLFAFSFFLFMAGQTAFIPKPIDRSSVAPASTSTLTKNLDSNFSTLNKYSQGPEVIVSQFGKVLAKKAYSLAGLEFSVAFTHNTMVHIPYLEGSVISLASRDTNHTTKNVL